MYNLSCIYRKLHTNARLTSGEEDKVRRSRRKTLIKLEAIESEIARLQDRLSILHQRRKETEDCIHVHQVLISPIRRLSPEILQEIFWRCLPAAHNSVCSFEEAPLLLGRVCSQWHQIAYSTPKLWSSLHMVVVPPKCPSAEALLEAFGAWLARSGMLPLYISMVPALQNPILPYVSQPYFDLIAKYARRLKSIHFGVNLLDPCDLLKDLHGGDLPLLETLYIHDTTYIYNGIGAHWPFKKDCILSAPLLRILSLHGYSTSLLDLPVQWSRLTGLDLDPRTFEPSDVFEILNLCSNLETCSINFLESVSKLLPAPDIRSKIVLSKLQTLKLHGVSILPHDESLTLLDNLYTPVLRHFAYQHRTLLQSLWTTFPFTELLSSLEIFRSFFQRLNEPLEELDLVGYGLGMRFLMELLPLLPELKRLSLRAHPISPIYSVNDRLLLGFIPYEHDPRFRLCLQDEDSDLVIPSPPFYPKLETLYVDNALFSKHVLFEFLRSRLVNYDRYNFVRLRRFTISCDFPNWDNNGDIMEEIDRLAEESGIVDMRLSKCLGI